MEVVDAGVGLPGVLTRHPVGEGGEDVEGVPAGGESQAEEGLGEGGGDDVGESPGDGPGEIVDEDGGEHAGEEEGGVVVVDVEDSAHGPEGDVVQGPAEEQPGGRHQRPLPLLHHGGTLDHAPLGLEAGPGVDHQEYEEEDDVAPPDDGIAQEVDPGLVVSG